MVNIPESNRIYEGDCLDVMASWPENFVDTIITDPPYGLSFMGKEWDHGVPGCHFWAEALRIAKPGALLLAFGGTRTYHRLAVAIEDAGWEIRDCLMWLYGSGFPKSLDISKALDKAKGAERVPGPKRVSADGTIGHDRAGARHEGYERPWRSDEEAVDRNTRVSYPATDLAREWSGWGTALKPAWEPIIVAMKPIDGTFAENAEKWGVAGLNADGGRIGANGGGWNGLGSTHEESQWRLNNPDGKQRHSGRWPANLILDEDAAAMLDEKTSGQIHGAGFARDKIIPNNYTGTSYQFEGERNCRRLGDSGGASRFFYVAKADRTERNEGCDELPTVECQTGCGGAMPIDDDGKERDRFKERAQNHHPTVKPLSLMKYLCNLTRTPTGGIVLDPFCGSGTTLWAAECHNRPWVGIELNPEYVAIANARIAKERSQLKMAI